MAAKQRAKVINTELWRHVYLPSESAAGQAPTTWPSVCTFGQKSHSDVILDPHRSMFVLLGSELFKYLIAKLNILRGMLSKTRYQLLVLLGRAKVQKDLMTSDCDKSLLTILFSVFDRISLIACFVVL